MVHGDGKTDKKSLVDFVLEMRPEIKGVGETFVVDGKNVERSGVVHRLDEETSGVIVFAKNQEAYDRIKNQFQEHVVKKEYHAFVWGHLKETHGTVNAPIGRSPSDFRRWLAGRGARGETRNAITEWQVVENFFDENEDKFSFIKLFPHTGRTHQLRVHMKYLQKPIVSDSLYVPNLRKALGFDRVALHARKITFIGLDGEQISIEAPYPGDFDQALAHYCKKC